MNDQRLAAIMFTDIVGYTSLMADDELVALEIVSNLRDVLQPIIQSHRGQWLKEMGDGTLSSFSSATSAVQCAIEIQKQLKQDPSFKIRIGIHLGDVVFTETDVFGDGVNIAARIEPNAEPGGIAVSGSVYDTLSNNKHFQTVLLGEKTLKNVGRPLRIYAISNDDLPVGKTFAERLTISLATTLTTPSAPPLATTLSTSIIDKESEGFRLGTLKSKPLAWSAAAIIVLILASLLNLQPRPIAISDRPSTPVLETDAAKPMNLENSNESTEDLQLTITNRILVPGEQEAAGPSETTGIAGTTQTTETKEDKTDEPSNDIDTNGRSDNISANTSNIDKTDATAEDALTEIVLSEPAFVSPTQPGLVIAPDSVPVQTLNTTEKPPAAVLESPVSN